MVQNIRFKGLNLAVDEQAVENGALAVCDGMELHNGALRPCVIDGEEITSIDGEILYIHELSETQKNAIITDEEGNLSFQDITIPDAEPQPLGSTDSRLKRNKITSVTSIGNTLIMLTIDGMRYFKWNITTYKYLGEMPPDVEMSFYLAEGKTLMYDFVKNDYNQHHQKYVQYNRNYDTEARVSYAKKSTYVSQLGAYNVSNSVDYSDNKTLLTREEANDTAINKMLTQCNRAGYFALPFYVRYCYRLWDGRKIMHSAPVLLFSDITIPVAVAIGTDDTPNTHCHFPLLLPQQLQMYFTYEHTLEQLKNDWSDIVKSIDIYATPGISRTDEDYKVDIPESGEYPSEGKWKKVSHINTTSTDNQSVTLINRELQQIIPYNKIEEIRKGEYSDWPNVSNPDKFFVIDESKSKSGVYIPRQVDDVQWRKRLTEQNAYYLIKRYDIKEDTIESGPVRIDYGILDGLEAQEPMISSTSPDDYGSHNSIIATNAYVYNNRVNLSGVSEIPFEGFRLRQMMPNILSTSLKYESVTDETIHVFSTIIRLEDGTNHFYLRRDFLPVEMTSPWYLNNTFIFYPDNRAKEMWIIDDNTTPNLVAHFNLEEHPFLNGVYHIGNLCELSTVGTYVKPNTYTFPITGNPRLEQPSYIFASASGNPFIYPAANRYKIGMGKVMAMAATTKALSQGQFGQYPLLAFATDGIYALNVSSTGSYSDIQSISREVITNAKGLLQLDQSIAFVTKRAISQLMGSDVQSISDTLSGPMRDLSTLLGYLPATKEMHDLIGAVQNAEALYDFANRRLLYFIKEDEAFTGDVLVMCADDDAWAFKSLGSTVKGIYNSYPYPYIHKSDGKLVQLSEPYDNKNEGAYEGIIVSRTIKSEGVRNAVRGFVQDYDIDLSGDTDKRPMLMIWGSDDNRTWHYVGKSNAREMSRLAGRIYKYFRIAVKFTGMKKNDLYHSLDLDIQERFTR